MTKDPGAGRGDAVGLCARCAHVRSQGSAKGSVFYRCGLADLRPGFSRYPQLPVLACAGYSPEADDIG